MLRSSSSSTLLSEGRVGAGAFAIPTRYTVEPQMLSSRPAPVQMTKSASIGALSMPSEYSSAAYRMGSLVPAPNAFQTDHTLSHFADPHPSQAQLQLAEQQYNIRMSEWNQHVALQHSQSKSRTRSKYRLIQEQRRAMAEANRRKHPMQAWIDGQKRVGYALRPRTEHEFTPGTYTTLADVSASNLAHTIQQHAKQHRAPPQRPAPQRPAPQRLAKAHPQPHATRMSAEPAGGGRIAAAVAAAAAAGGSAAPDHRAPPPGPAPVRPRHRPPPPAYDALSIDTVSSAYLNGSSAQVSVSGEPLAAHRSAPRMAPESAHRPPPRPPPRPLPVAEEFDGEAMAMAIKAQKLAKAEAEEALKMERKENIATPALKKDLLLISGAIQNKFTRMHDGFRKMNCNSGTKLRSSSSLTAEEFTQGIRSYGLPIPQNHIDDIAELMMNDKGAIELQGFVTVLKGSEQELY